MHDTVVVSCFISQSGSFFSAGFEVKYDTFKPFILTYLKSTLNFSNDVCNMYLHSFSAQGKK